MLHAESTTQSALSLRVAISEAVRSPSLSGVAVAGGVRTSAGSARPEIARHQPVRRKLDDAIAFEPGLAQQRLGGAIGEIEVLFAGTERLGDRSQFVRSLG